MVVGEDAGRVRWDGEQRVKRSQGGARGASVAGVCVWNEVAAHGWWHGGMEAWWHGGTSAKGGGTKGHWVHRCGAAAAAERGRGAAAGRRHRRGATAASGRGQRSHLLFLLFDHLHHVLDLHRRVGELLEAALELVALVADGGALLAEQRAVALDELEVVGRRHVVGAAEAREHRRRLGEHRGLRLREDGRDGPHQRLVDLGVLEELGGDLLERVGRPLGEPVDRRAADERGEHAHVVAVALADGRHAEHDVQPRAHALDKVAPQDVVGLGEARGAHVGAHRLADGRELLGRVEVGHLAGCLLPRQREAGVDPSIVGSATGQKGRAHRKKGTGETGETREEGAWGVSRPGRKRLPTSR